MRLAAFLRAINVGGRRLSNDQLRAHLEAIGMRDVEVYRASGNVVFASERGSPAQLTARIERELLRLLGYEVAAFLRTADELRAIAEHEPFPGPAVERSAGKLQVGLLQGPPARKGRTAVLALAEAGDELAFGERELYWLPRAGMLDSALDMKAFEALLGPITFRTKNTLVGMVRKYLPDERPRPDRVA